jgi:hypothetical protein
MHLVLTTSTRWTASTLPDVNDGSKYVPVSFMTMTFSVIDKIECFSAIEFTYLWHSAMQGTVLLSDDICDSFVLGSSCASVSPLFEDHPLDAFRWVAEDVAWWARQYVDFVCLKIRVHWHVINLLNWPYLWTSIASRLYEILRRPYLYGRLHDDGGGMTIYFAGFETNMLLLFWEYDWLIGRIM